MGFRKSQGLVRPAHRCRRFLEGRRAKALRAGRDLYPGLTLGWKSPYLIDSMIYTNTILSYCYYMDMQIDR